MLVFCILLSLIICCVIRFNGFELDLSVSGVLVCSDESAGGLIILCFHLFSSVSEGV